MNGIMLLYPTHYPARYPKDVSIKKLREKFNTTCKYKFMIAYHNRDNLRKIVMRISLKSCEWLENSTTCHADTLGVNILR